MGVVLASIPPLIFIGAVIGQESEYWRKPEGPRFTIEQEGNAAPKWANAPIADCNRDLYLEAEKRKLLPAEKAAELNRIRKLFPLGLPCELPIGVEPDKPWTAYNVANTMRVKRNVNRMIGEHASEESIDAYVAAEGLTAEQLKQAPKLGTEPKMFDDLVPVPSPVTVKVDRPQYGQWAGGAAFGSIALYTVCWTLGWVLGGFLGETRP